jgi:hypothetical protein
MSGWCEFDPNNAFYDTICYVAPPVDTTHLHDGITTLGTSSFSGIKVFPNPAKDNATLIVNVKANGIVKADILDMNGRVVKQIFNGELYTGKQSIEFNTNELSSGLYIITVMADQKLRTVKFTVAK